MVEKWKAGLVQRSRGLQTDLPDISPLYIKHKTSIIHISISNSAFLQPPWYFAEFPPPNSFFYICYNH